MLSSMDTDLIKQRFASLEPFLDERLRRLYAAAEAKALGRGGVSAVARATGVSRGAIASGLRELGEPAVTGVTRIRRPGGRRKRTVDQDASLVHDLQQLVEPDSRGDPKSPLRWTCKSVRKLAEELNRQGHQGSHRLVAELLQDLGYSLQANRKTSEGAVHAYRLRPPTTREFGWCNLRHLFPRGRWGGTHRNDGEATLRPNSGS
jgi:transposase